MAKIRAGIPFTNLSLPIEPGSGSVNSCIQLLQKCKWIDLEFYVFGALSRQPKFSKALLDCTRGEIFHWKRNCTNQTKGRLLYS